MVLTGWQIYSGWQIFGQFAVARAIHPLAPAGLFISYVIVRPYRLYVTGEYKHFRPTFDIMKTELHLWKNFFGISPYYPEIRTYDVQKKDFFRKYHFAQIVLLYILYLVLIVMGITGVAMKWPDQFGFITSALGGAANVRALHLISFYIFLANGAGHIYQALWPTNWRLLRARFTGWEKAWSKGRPIPP
jgi:thiosulfate reductase cytochrome b subunit